MCTCGDGYILGGTNGFVGFGSKVRTGDGTVAIICTFPSLATDSDSSGSGIGSSNNDNNSNSSGSGSGSDNVEDRVEEKVDSKEEKADNSNNNNSNSNNNENSISYPSTIDYNTAMINKRRSERNMKSVKKDDKIISNPLNGNMPSISVLRNRGHGYYSNITCVTSSPDPDNLSGKYVRVVSVRTFVDTFISVILFHVIILYFILFNVVTFCVTQFCFISFYEISFLFLFLYFLEESVSLFAAGDDMGGISLWRIYPKGPGTLGPKPEKKEKK